MRSIFLALTVTTAYVLLRGRPEELHPVLRTCFAVLVLVLGMGMWRRRKRPSCSLARSVRAPGWPDYLAIGLAILSVECLFLCFLSVVPSHAESISGGVVNTLFPPRVADRQSANGDGDPHGTTVSGNWLWDSQGRRRLPLSSNARPSDKPEIFFRPRDAATSARLLRSRIYLRAFALEKFDDSTWSPVGMTPELLLPDESGIVNLKQPEGRPGPLLRGEIIQPSHPGGDDLFTAPQGATRGRVEQLRHVDPGIFRLNPAADPEQGHAYEVAARTVTLTSLLESGVLDRFRFPALPEDSHLLELPANEELRDEVINLSSKTLRDAASRLVGLRKLLWENYLYSLEIDNPEKLDPMLNFMRHEKRGHCEFFATAGALLSRALNIPSRIAYGWSGGKWYSGPGYFMFRASEAHAWTEIYLDNVGWVVFDTTPPGARTRLDIADTGEDLPLSKEGLPDFSASPGRSFEDSALWISRALGAGLALVPLCFLILRFRRGPARIPGAASGGLLPEPPRYLARFRQACAQRGQPMPPGRTLRQQLSSLAKTGQMPSFSEDLLKYHYAITYGNALPDKFRESALLRAIKLWV